MTKFTQEETQFIINLIKSYLGSKNMIRGFRKPTQEDKEKDAYYNNLIKKLKELEI